jgi:hypothetical protein
MSDLPPAALLEAARADAAGPSEDSLQRLRALVVATQALELEKADLEQRLKDTNIALQDHYYHLLPDLFDEAGVESVTLPPEGNTPGIKASASPYYRANIAAEWDPDKRKAAFNYLESLAAGDLIKTIIKISYNREDHEQAKKMVDMLKALRLNLSIEESVHWGTLTSWLREQVEVKKTLPDLDKIGGTVGRVVRLKETKDAI